MASGIFTKRLQFANALQRRHLSLDMPPELARSAYLDALEEVYGRRVREAAEKRGPTRYEKERS